MEPRTLTGETLQQMALFQERTGVEPLDCVESETKVIYVVPEGQVGRAVGKAGQTVNRLRRLLNKEVQVVEYSSDPAGFIENVFRNYGVREVTLEDREDHVHATVAVDPLKKGRAIGKEGRNLRLARDLISRHHEVQSVVVA